MDMITMPIINCGSFYNDEKLHCLLASAFVTNIRLLEEESSPLRVRDYQMLKCSSASGDWDFNRMKQPSSSCVVSIAAGPTDAFLNASGAKRQKIGTAMFLNYAIEDYMQDNDSLRQKIGKASMHTRTRSKFFSTVAYDCPRLLTLSCRVKWPLLALLRPTTSRSRGPITQADCTKYVGTWLCP